MNATDYGMLTDRRRLRAQRMASEIMQAIAPVLDRADDDRDGVNRSDLYHAIGDLLTTTGADVVTDADRAVAGLPPRNELGYTAQELAALEAFRLDLIARPFSPVLFGTDIPDPEAK